MRVWIQKLVAAAFYAVVVYAACGPAGAGHPVVLNSGKTVDILQVGPLFSTHGWTALALKYRTQVPIDDLHELRKEVDEIWERFEVDVEAAGHQMAVIMASGPETGWVVTTNRAFNFVFEKHGGSWRGWEGPRDAPRRLDEPFVRQLVDRLMWAQQHNNMRALLLHMADDWTLRLGGPKVNPAAPKQVDRRQYVSTLHRVLKIATDRHSEREIVGITIQDEGRAARVVSWAKTQLTINGKRISGEERSTDHFVVQGNYVLWTQSESSIERHSEEVVH